MAVMFGRRKKFTRGRKTQGGLPRQFWVGVVLSFVLIIVAAVVWYGARLESLTITTVRVHGGETIDREALRAAIAAELEGEYYRLVPRRFVWTYPEASIQNKVNAWPRVRAASLDVSERNTLDIYLEEYLPYALWCAGETGGLVKDPCVFIAADGKAFAIAPALTGTALLRYYNAKIPAEGVESFTPTFLRDTSHFASELSSRLGFEVSVVEWIGQDDVSFYLRGGGILKTTLRRPVDDTLDDLTVVLASKQFEHIRPGNFAYIDLRFGDKVFVNENRGMEDKTVIATSSIMQ